MLPNVIIGAGLIGLATARELQLQDPDRPVVILEKEADVAVHQSGNNSGVIHSGLYYTPGSLKAKMAVEGGQVLRAFCEEHGIAHDFPGKLVIATKRTQLPALDALYERGQQNGIPVRLVDQNEIRQLEPALSALKGMFVESTGRVDYRDVARALQGEIERNGGEIRFGTVVSVVSLSTVGQPTVRTSGGVIAAYRVAVCVGLYSDRLARASGIDPGVTIIPFRGEFRTLVDEGAEMVRGLVYPVPDPDLPFLGVHLTRGIDDHVHVGPNAVPAFAREGYRWTRISPRDLFGMLRFRGTWPLAVKYAGTGIREILRSLSGKGLYREAKKMLPRLQPRHLADFSSGVRAQAVDRDGKLVDDFLFEGEGRVLHVLNAPSPAATACLVIGRSIAERLIAGDRA